jgi:hypothetical protein
VECDQVLWLLLNERNTWWRALMYTVYAGCASLGHICMYPSIVIRHPIPSPPAQRTIHSLRKGCHSTPKMPLHSQDVTPLSRCHSPQRTREHTCIEQSWVLRSVFPCPPISVSRQLTSVSRQLTSVSAGRGVSCRGVVVGGGVSGRGVVVGPLQELRRRDVCLSLFPRRTKNLLIFYCATQLL